MPLHNDDDESSMLTLTGKPRRRLTQSCDRCKLKKRRCSGSQPCSNCAKAHAPCTMLVEQKKRGPKRPSGAGRRQRPRSSSHVHAAASRPPVDAARVDDDEDEEEDEDVDDVEEGDEEDSEDEDQEEVKTSQHEGFRAAEVDDCKIEVDEFAFKPSPAASMTSDCMDAIYEPLEDEQACSLLASTNPSAASFFGDLDGLDQSCPSFGFAADSVDSIDLPLISPSAFQTTPPSLDTVGSTYAGSFAVNQSPEDFHLHLINLFFTFFAPINPMILERSFFDSLMATGLDPAQPRVSPALLNAVYAIGVLYSIHPDVSSMGGRLQASADFAVKAQTSLKEDADVIARCLIDVRQFGCSVSCSGCDVQLFPGTWRIAQKMQLGYDAPRQNIYSVINPTPSTAAGGGSDEVPEFRSAEEKKRGWWGVFALDTFVTLCTGYDLSIDEAAYMESLLDGESLVRGVSHPLAAERSILESRREQPRELLSRRPSFEKALDWCGLLGGYPTRTIFDSKSWQDVDPRDQRNMPVSMAHLITPLSDVHPHIRISIFLRKVLRSTLHSFPSQTMISGLHGKVMQLVPAFPLEIRQYLSFDQTNIPHGKDLVPTNVVHSLLMFFATLSLIHQTAVQDPTPLHDVNGTLMSSPDICLSIYRRLNVLLEDAYAFRYAPPGLVATPPIPPQELVSSPFTAVLIAIPVVPVFSTRHAESLLTPALGTVPCLDQTVLPTLDEMAVVWPRASAYAAGLRGWCEVVRERGAMSLDDLRRSEYAFDI